MEFRSSQVNEYWSVTLDGVVASFQIGPYFINLKRARIWLFLWQQHSSHLSCWVDLNYDIEGQSSKIHSIYIHTSNPLNFSMGWDKTFHFTELRMDGHVMYWTFFRWATLGPFYCPIHYLKFSAFDILYVVESGQILFKDMLEENLKAVHRVYSSWLTTQSMELMLAAKYCGSDFLWIWS